jgi:hypothetical protein
VPSAQAQSILLQRAAGYCIRSSVRLLLCAIPLRKCHLERQATLSAIASSIRRGRRLPLLTRQTTDKSLPRLRAMLDRDKRPSLGIPGSSITHAATG